MGPLRPLDHLEADCAPGPQLPQRGDQVPRVRLSGPDAPQAGEGVPEAREPTLGARAVLHLGRRAADGPEYPYGIDEDMPLAAMNVLVRRVAVAPPFSVVLTAWLSMIPALGWRCRPVATRTSPRSRSWSTCQVPSCCHVRKA